MLLEVKGLHGGYGNVQVLHGIDLTVARGEIVAILGANGAGKSTTLRVLSGLLKSSAGSITLDGKQVEQLPPHRLVKLGITHVPEGRRIFGTLTVRENLDLGAFSRDDRDRVEETRARVLGLFPVLGNRSGQMGGTLSGGEQQMLAIGRALMARPKLLLLDEPSLGLAPLLVKAIFRTLREIRDAGVTILLVEQNARAALRLADRGYVMETGRIALAGASGRLLENPEVQKAYLGN